MRRRDFYWSLYNEAEQNQIDDLRTDQVEAVYAAIPERQRVDWFIWRDGTNDWKPFTDFPELLLSLRKIEGQSVWTPPPPQSTGSGRSQKPARSKSSEKASSKSPPRTGPGPAKFELDTDANGDLTLVRTRLGEDRGNFRFETELEVRIMVADKTYANTTVNISLKGMQLKGALPKNLPRYFNVEIRKKDQVIPVVCSEVKSTDGKPSNRVKIEVNDHSPALLAILLGGAQRPE